jgi:Tfp pilus assembly major pilin PilA
MTARTRQTGLTMIGFLFVAAVLIVVAVVGLRVTPSYIEYFSVQRALEQALRDSKEVDTPREVRLAFGRIRDAGYITSVGPNDIEVTKEGNTIYATASWDSKLHLISNVSLLIEFEAVASR